MRVLVSSGALHFTNKPSYSEGFNAFQLCRALTDKGVELKILAPSIDTESRIDGVEIIGLGRFEKYQNLRSYAIQWFRYNLKMLVEARKIAKKMEPDLIHHIFPSWIDSGYSLYPIFDRTKPFVYGPILTQRSVESQESRTPKDRLVNLYMRVISRRLYVQTLTRATKVIVSLEHAHNYLPPFVREKSTTICHGIDARFFSPGKRRREHSGFVVVFVARLRPEKGASVAIKAISLTKNKIPGITLKIAGDGPEIANLEALARREGVEDSIQFLGIVEHDRVPELLRDSDVLCCPSLEDASPTSVLEGMACGLPIVATRIAGIPEMLGNGNLGMLVKPNSPKDVSDAFVKLYEDPESAKRMGERARGEIERNYDWSIIAEKVLRVYEECLG